MYGNHVRERKGQQVDSVSVNKFRDNLKTLVDQVINGHAPLKVTRRGSEGFVVMSVEDWEREQETLYVLQNNALMEQIAASSTTHARGEGRKTSKEALDEITGV